MRPVVVSLGAFEDQTQTTLKLCAGLAKLYADHPWIIQAARHVAAQGVSPQAQARAAWEYVRGTVKYRRDPDWAEWVQDPLETLYRTKEGDCDDQAVVVGAILAALGHDIEMRAIKWTDRPFWTHCVCYSSTAGQTVDPVAPFDPASWPGPQKKVDKVMKW